MTSYPEPQPSRPESMPRLQDTWSGTALYPGSESWREIPVPVEYLPVMPRPEDVSEDEYDETMSSLPPTTDQFDEYRHLIALNVPHSQRGGDPTQWYINRDLLAQALNDIPFSREPRTDMDAETQVSRRRRAYVTEESTGQRPGSELEVTLVGQAQEGGGSVAVRMRFKADVVERILADSYVVDPAMGPEGERFMDRHLREGINKMSDGGL